LTKKENFVVKSKDVKLTIVAGARPNFIKIAALIREIKKRPGIGLAIQACTHGAAL
jgi:UDP-N-acetylglucosamine 2-epimerase